MYDILFLIFVIIAALAYDFVNGFHDAANAIATSIASNALQPRAAILLATAFNFIGALSHTAVAYTIGKGVVDSSVITQDMLAAALVAAIAWNLVTWKWGLPSSSTHALIGGLIGAAVVGTHFDWSILMLPSIKKIMLAMIFAPIAAFILALLVITLITWTLHRMQLRHRQVNKRVKSLQILSAAWMSFSHGMNDAQNAMGIITISLLTYGVIHQFEVPMPIRILCAASMGAGTLFGGWRIIRTITDELSGDEPMPVEGFSAQTSAGGVIFLLSLWGVPISTSHAISSCVMGTTAAKRFGLVNWKIGGNMLVAWLITIPATMVLAGLLTYVF